VHEPADHSGHGEGHEGRSREVHLGRRVGLPGEADRHRAAPLAAARLAVLRADGGAEGMRTPGPRMPADAPSVLIVDDSPDKLVALEAILRELGVDIVTARSGKEALRHLLVQDFAVVLLDVRMPGMDG